MPPHDLPPANNALDLQAWPVIRRFLPYLWPRHSPQFKSRIVLSGLLVTVAKTIQLSMGFLLAAIIDRMAPGLESAVALALGLTAAYAGARFAGVLFDNLRNLTFERVGQKATQHLAENVFSHLHRLSLRFHLSRRTGEVTKVIERGTKSIDTMLYFLLFNIAPTIIELAAILVIFTVKFSPWLSLATACLVAIYIYLTGKVTNWRNRLRMTMNDLDSLAVARSVDSLLNFETVKYFGAEDREAKRYSATVDKYAEAAIKSENSLAALNISQSFLTNAMLGGAMAFTVWGWSRGDFSTGDVVLVNTLLLQLFRPLDFLGMVYRTIRQGVIDMGAMFRLLDREAEVQDKPTARDLNTDGGEVRFDNVDFGYEPDRTVIRNLTFTVPAGERVAVVGSSGAGKSTLARLLFRFYDPQSGTIAIDGQNIADVTQHSLRAAIGIVPQDSVLFNDTIGYNIGYGRENATDSEIMAAADEAAIGDFIRRLPDGLATEVGERGLKLSGGEKQRVAIARTLLKNPPILIFDEATSALDSRTEQSILSTLRSVSRQRTVLTIAHRLSTIVDSDRILVLDKGQVAEEGSHAALLARNGLYADLWSRQARKLESQ